MYRIISIIKRYKKIKNINNMIYLVFIIRIVFMVNKYIFDYKIFEGLFDNRGPDNIKHL
jgi:hypothetical protein